MNEQHDNELAEQIRRAFHAQEIPDRPANLTLGANENNPSRGVTGFEVLVPMTVVLIGVLIAIAIWPENNSADRSIESESTYQAELDSEQSVPETNERTPMIDETRSMMVDSQPTTAVPPSESETTSIEEENPGMVEPDASLAGPLRKTIDLVNQCLSERHWRPEPLADRLVGFLRGDEPTEVQREELFRALVAVGVPQGVKSVELARPEVEPWLQEPSRLMFQYRYNPSGLEADTRKFINALFGADLFDPVLNGIREDRDGPRVDLRKDFFPKLAGQLLLSVDRHGSSGEERLLLAIRLTDDAPVRILVRKAMLSEPNVSTQKVNEVTVYDFGGTVAVCVADGYLLVSDVKLVLEALRRRSDNH
ncbi:MAG: hypothetical protein AAFX06_05950 [Planctomycetota bacterium]